MSKIFRNRLGQVHAFLKKQSTSTALVISSSAAALKNRDTYFPFRQNSDFRYLTGSTGQDLVLFISSERKRPILIAPPIDKLKVIWEGPREDGSQLAEKLGAELIVSADYERELRPLLRGIACIVFQNEEGTKAWKLAQKLIATPSHLRGDLPRRFVHSDVILEPLRLYKMPEEIALIREAGLITNASLLDVVPSIAPGATEQFLATSLDFFFKIREALPSFDTIVATGRSAATLHHEPTSKELKKGELLLIDCGAELEGYAADITRTIPVSGVFTDVQQDLYSAVLEAQAAAIRTVKHGVTIQKVFTAAAEELTYGLVHAKVLKGKVSQLLKKKAYAPFFPHGIGHSLGLDVHDIGNLRANNGATLEAGMVFTIEPGLYFQKRHGLVPPMGIRIEDDVLVTQRGAEVLSAGFPKEANEVAAMMKEVHA